MHESGGKKGGVSLFAIQRVVKEMSDMNKKQYRREALNAMVWMSPKEGRQKFHDFTLQSNEKLRGNSEWRGALYHVLGVSREKLRFAGRILGPNCQTN